MLKMIRNFIDNRKVKKEQIKKIIEAVKKNHDIQEGMRAATGSHLKELFTKQKSYET